MTPVGRVVSIGVAPCLDGSVVEQLIKSADFAVLATATHDSRMSALAWEHCLKYELAMLANWLARRTLAYHSSEVAGAGAVPSSVVTLLPRYGFALHALRRSIPFAALGIPTTISVAEAFRNSARQTITPLLKALGAEDLIVLAEPASVVVVERAVADGVPIYLTGRPATWRRLVEQYPAATIVGSTGECAVILSSDPVSAAEVNARLAERALPISCTNHQLTLITSGPIREDSTVVQASGPLGTARPGTVANELARVHPSVVLVPDTQDFPAATVLAGYRAVRCDPAGSASTTVGFGLDPVAGWPGDHNV